MAHCIRHGSYDPWAACYDSRKIICRKCWEEENLKTKYYPGLERDDGWTQRIEKAQHSMDEGRKKYERQLEESRQKYEAEVDSYRRKAGLPSLSQTVVPPSTPLLTAKLQHAIMEVERVLQAGEVKYPNEKWRTQGWREHIAHAMTHLLQLNDGILGEDHLAHAACRLLMALEKRNA
jgi:hypothetical protein